MKLLKWLADDFIIFEIKGIVKMTNGFVIGLLFLVFYFGFWLGTKG